MRNNELGKVVNGTIAEKLQMPPLKGLSLVDSRIRVSELLVGASAEREREREVGGWLSFEDSSMA